MKKTLLTCVAALAAFAFVFAVPGDGLAAAPSVAAKEKLLGTFGAWRAYAYDEGGQNVCYMVAMKTIKSVGPKKRTQPYLMITHRPVEASTDVVSYGAGADMDAKHGVRMRIGKNDFDLFSVHDTAWARDALTDHKLVVAMKESATAQASGVASMSGAVTVNDTFDLAGMGEAYRAIGRACGLPGNEEAPAATPVTPKKTAPQKAGKAGAKASAPAPVNSAPAKAAAKSAPAKAVATKAAGKVAGKKAAPAKAAATKGGAGKAEGGKAAGVKAAGTKKAAPAAAKSAKAAAKPTSAKAHAKAKNDD